MSSIIVNHKLVSAETPCIRHNDRGFTLGHGLFETILVKKNTFPVLSYHWKRLKTSAAMIGIRIPFTRQTLELMLTELVLSNQLHDKIAAARITITHGESERSILPLKTPQANFLISVAECASPIDSPYSVCIVNTRKNEHTVSTQIKSISCLDNILAKQEARSRGYDEAVLLNSVSNIADGAASTIYLVKDSQIMTPRVTDGALPGVIRRILLTEFKHLFQIVERTISHAQLLEAEEVFLTNALMGVKPVWKVDEREYNSFVIANRIGNAVRKVKNYI